MLGSLAERHLKMAIDKKALGNQLRSWRTNIGMGQSELAKRTNISASYVSYLEKDKKIPTLPVALALASTLGPKPPERLVTASSWIQSDSRPCGRGGFYSHTLHAGSARTYSRGTRRSFTRSSGICRGLEKSAGEKRAKDTEGDRCRCGLAAPFVVLTNSGANAVTCGRSRRQAFLTCMLLSQ